MISWIGNVFIVIGLWFIGSKKRWAFIFSMLGEALWIAAAIRRHEFDLAFICVIFFALAARSYSKWGDAKPVSASVLSEQETAKVIDQGIERVRKAAQN